MTYDATTSRKLGSVHYKIVQGRNWSDFLDLVPLPLPNRSIKKSRNSKKHWNRFTTTIVTTSNLQIKELTLLKCNCWNKHFQLIKLKNIFVTRAPICVFQLTKRLQMIWPCCHSPLYLLTCNRFKKHAFLFPMCCCKCWTLWYPGMAWMQQGKAMDMEGKHILRKREASNTVVYLGIIGTSLWNWLIYIISHILFI